MMDERREAEEVAREIAEEIAKFRSEFWDKLCVDIDDELHEMETSGYDPARGSGRGPKWAEGA